MGLRDTMRERQQQTTQQSAPAQTEQRYTQEAASVPRAPAQAQAQIPQHDPVYDRIAKASIDNNRGLMVGTHPYLYVDSIQMKLDSKDKKLFIIELHVIESGNTEQPAGSTCCRVCHLEDEWGYGIKEAKAFVMALYDKEELDIEPDDIAFLTSDKNPGHGRLIRAEAWAKPMKAGHSIVKVRWEVVSEEDQALAEESHKEVFGS